MGKKSTPAAVDEPAVAGESPRITVAGEWYEMGAMTGRDFLTVSGLKGRKLNETDIAALFTLIERRVITSSVPDPVDRPIAELLELLSLWAKRKGTVALPPATASS